MAAITVQAPVLSIFISSIRSAGLMLMPPESKQTPLPTIARWRPSASFSPFPARAHARSSAAGCRCPAPRRGTCPCPSSAARVSVDDVDRTGRARRRSRASSARTCGVTSLAARFDSRRATFAPSPMIRPRSAAFASAAASPPGAIRISSSRTGGGAVAVLAVDRLGLEAALDHAARDELGDERERPRRGRRRAGRARRDAP